MSKPDGDPAFPKPSVPGRFEQDGMSLRDWFAGQAVSAALTSLTLFTPEGMAKRCYEIADAMLAEREKE